MNKKIEKSQELVFGIHPIIELLKAKRRKLITLYTTKPTPKAFDQIAKLLPKTVNIQYVARDVLHKLAGTTDHQGVIAWTTPLPFMNKFFEPSKQPFLVLLDGIQDPRNVGGIIRSAYCTNASGIIMVRKRGAPLNAVAFKSSAGLAEYLPFYEAPSAAAAVELLKKAGYAIYLAALGGQDALKTEYKTPLCLVIGNEAIGISPEILKSGTKVMLAQKDPEISYNASVAAGILLFTIATKQSLL